MTDGFAYHGPHAIRDLERDRDDALKAMKSARDISEGRRKALAEARAERDKAEAQRDALAQDLKWIGENSTEVPISDCAFQALAALEDPR